MCQESDDFKKWYQEQFQKILQNPELNYNKKIILFDLNVKKEEVSENLLKHLKETVIRVFRRHHLISYLATYSQPLLDAKDYIDDTVTVERSEIWLGFGLTIGEHTKWLAKLVRDTPGFDKFDSDDLSTIIHSSVGLTYCLDTNKYYTDEENFTVLHNKVQFSRKRMNNWGENLTILNFNVNNTIRKLNLSESERALFYPVIFCSANENTIKNKSHLNELKSYFNTLLLREFEANQRDEAFNQILTKFFEQISICEIFKDEFRP